MSIIQTIREKGARVTVVVIAVALVGFILTDYFQSRGGGGGSTSNLVGKVNGKGLDFEDFNRKVDQNEENLKQQGYPASPSLTQMAIDNTWEQEVGRIVMEEEFQRLGIGVGRKELGEILYGPNAPADLKNQFTDPQTGQYNAVQAKQQIDQILKKGTPEQKASFNNYINQLILQRKYEKYLSLFTNSTNVPRWVVEKQNADNSLMAKALYVRELYSSVPDSAAIVTDKEIAAYINKHKDEFKQNESRSISYVAFDASPSATDSAAARNKALALKAKLEAATDVDALMETEGIDPGFSYNGYRSASAITSMYKDSIIKQPAGTVFGPYLEGSNYMLAKLEGARTIPDTVKLRHILIATTQRDPQSGQDYPVRDTASAYKLADSIRTAIAGGANFDTLCVKYSEDPGSKDKGGVYENVPSGQMVGAFNDFIFTKPVGSKGIVKTVFGYHYLEVLSQKGSGMGYKIAYLPVEITVSQETENNALNEATLFAGDSRDLKSFDENYEKQLKSKGINKALATLAPRDATIPGLGTSREFVRAVYEAKAGRVMKPIKIEMKYVVAVVTEVLKEGTMSVDKARSQVEAALRNNKKAEVLKKKLGQITTLEAAAATLGGRQIETADSLRMTSGGGGSLGTEPRVRGAIFNPANKGKIVPEAIAGQSGVFVVQVETVTATPVTTGSVADQRKEQADQKRGMANPVEPLKKMAKIKDNRNERY